MTETIDNSSVDEAAGHCVYIYRDEKGKIRYVGYGKSLERATSRNRGKEMLRFLDQGKYTLELAGPYGYPETGQAVETALISLLEPDLNSKKAPGPTSLRFRPLGVPGVFSERLATSLLKRGTSPLWVPGSSCSLVHETFLKTTHDEIIL